MEGYKIGDISSFLNSSSSHDAPVNDLFAATPQVSVTAEEVYAKPAPPIVKGKRPKKNKPIELPAEPLFPKLSPEEQLEVDKRTLFVGNLPVGYKRKQLRKLFADFGKIETLRFRSVAISNLKLGRKACLKSNKVNENATNKNGYIVFENEECLEEACSKNGSLVNEHYIRVDKVIKSKKDVSNDSKNSVFVGNIPFSATEENLRVAFEQCGEIEYVRLLRDRQTNIGKGFGYVKFVDSAGVLLAMKAKDTVEVGGRQLRVQRCKSKMALEIKQKSKETKGSYKKQYDKGGAGADRGSFRGRKSKDTDKEMFAAKKPRSHQANNIPGKRPNKQKTMSKKKFDKKVNKVSKKSESGSSKGKKKV